MTTGHGGCHDSSTPTGFKEAVAKSAYHGNIPKKQLEKYTKTPDIEKNRASNHGSVLSHSSGLLKD